MEEKLNEKHAKKVDLVKLISQERKRSFEFREAYDSARAETFVARKLAEARARAKLSQVEVAKRLGTSQAAVSRMERPSYRGHTVASVARYASAIGHVAEITLRPVRVPVHVAAKRAAAPKRKKR